jgi:hypothetical protein
VTAQGYEISFGSEDNILKLAVVVHMPVNIPEYTSVYFKMGDFYDI